MNWGGVTGRVGIGERGLETIKHIVLMCEILLKGKSQKIINVNLRVAHFCPVTGRF